MDWVHKRRTCMPAMAALLIAMFVICSGMAASQGLAGGPLGSSGRISLDVIDADLSKVIMMLGRESSQSIIIADQENMHKKVTATLKDVPLETALKRIVESVGCTWSRDADGVYVITNRPLQAQPVEPAAPELKAPETYLPAAAPTIANSRGSMDYGYAYEARRETRTESIKLYNTSPVDMMYLLGLYGDTDAPRAEGPMPRSRGVDLRDPRSVNLLDPRQVTPPLTESIRSNPDYAQRAPGMPDEAAQFVGPGGIAGPGGVRPGGAPPSPGGTPANPPAGGSPARTQSSSLLPDGIEFVMPYELDNSLIVRGDEEGIEELKTILAKLDVAPKQIMIKAEFVEISTSDLEALGINWSVDRLNTSLRTEFTTPGNIVLGYANGNVMATLRAQISQSKAKLVNAPIISTINNVPASISVGTMVPYVSASTQVDANGNTTTSSFVDFLPVQSQLTVLPRVNNADNSISMFITPTLTDSPGTVDTPNGKIPITSSQSLSTNRRVGNGETIVLGGVIRKSESVSGSKIPFLGDLPVIGPLFRTKSKDINDKELLIFLTPTIVPERASTATGVGVGVGAWRP